MISVIILFKIHIHCLCFSHRHSLSHRKSKCPVNFLDVPDKMSGIFRKSFHITVIQAVLPQPYSRDEHWVVFLRFSQNMKKCPKLENVAIIYTDKWSFTFISRAHTYTYIYQDNHSSDSFHFYQEHILIHTYIKIIIQAILSISSSKARLISRAHTYAYIYQDNHSSDSFHFFI